MPAVMRVASIGRTRLLRPDGDVKRVLATLSRPHMVVTAAGHLGMCAFTRKADILENAHSHPLPPKADFEQSWPQAFQVDAAPWSTMLARPEGPRGSGLARSRIPRLGFQIRLNSTCRSARHNAIVGGVSRSHHIAATPSSTLLWSRPSIATPGVLGLERRRMPAQGPNVASVDTSLLPPAVLQAERMTQPDQV